MDKGIFCPMVQPLNGHLPAFQLAFSNKKRKKRKEINLINFRTVHGSGLHDKKKKKQK